MPKRKNRKVKKTSKKITPKLFSFKFKGKIYKLTPKEHLFCLKYLENRGNGVEAIIDAGYDVNYKDRKGNDTGEPNRKLAAVIAYENLIKPHIYTFINSKLNEYGYNDENVKKQHLFLINQDADLTNKRGGLDMYYKLKGKYAPDEIKHTITEVKVVSYAKSKRNNATS